MRTVFKFTFFVLLGISALGFVITAFLYIFAPDEAELVEDPEQVVPVSDSTNGVPAPTEVSDPETEQTTPAEAVTAPEPEVLSEQEPIVVEENEQTPLPPETKQISWDLTPAEQGLETDDWISIEGYQDDLIGATVEQYDATRVLKWNDPSHLFGINGLVDIASQSTGLPASSDKIIGVIGLVENPRENETVVQINKILLQEQTLLIRVVGQIDRIGGDKLPKRWTVFLKKGVHVDFVGQQIEENDSQ